MTKRTHLTTSTCAAAAAAAVGLALSLSACGAAAGSRPTGAPAVTGTHAGSGTQPATGTGQAAILTATGQGSTGSAPATITTTGTGSVTGTPDTLTIGVGVSTTALHAAPALAQNNAIAAAVQRALRSDGVAAADIQTTGLSLQPNYAPQLTGYQVYDEVTATVRNLARAGTIIDDALQPAGDAGRLDMANLSIANSSPLMAAARQRAVASARAEAEQLATAAGEHLGQLVSISDQSQQQYPYQGFDAAGGLSAARSAAAPVPVSPGTQQLSVDITAVWSITP